jgi:hypothetical protein
MSEGYAMKLHVLGLGVAFALVSLTSLTIADSKTSSSGGFSRSSPSVSHSEPARPETRAVETPKAQSGGFTRDRTSVPDAASPPKQSGGFSRDTGGTTQRATPPPAAPASAVDRIAQRSQSKAAFQQFQKEKTIYKAEPIAVPVNRQAAQTSAGWRTYGSGWHSYDDYDAARNRAFTRSPGFAAYYDERHPVWINRPSYGWIAAGFLGGALLDHYMEPGYSSWAYSNQDDPAYQAWHQDMMRQTADHEDLRNKMAELDAQVADLQAKNAPKTTALPPGVDPSLVIAPTTALVATTEESSGHPVLYTILGIVIGIVAALGFLWLCIRISQRKRAIA